MKFIAVLPLAIVASCTKPLDLEGHPCPCVSGYTCDARSHTCVRNDMTPDDALGANLPCGPFGECPPGEACGRDDRCHIADALDAASDSCQGKADNVMCGPPTASECDLCGGFFDTCDTKGTQSCTCKSFTCQNETCTLMSTTCMIECIRDTNGTTCGAPTLSNCGACSGSSDMGCAFDGNQICTCTDFVCMNDTCQVTSSTCNRNCAERAERDLCMIDPDSCGNGDLMLCCSGGSCGQPCGCRPR
jgi:hypothetical protein